MAGHWTSKFSYVTGVPRGRGVGAVALVSDSLAEQKIDHTVPMIWSNGDWKRSDFEKLDFTTVGMSVAENPLRQAAYLGLNGEVFFIGAGDEHEEAIHTTDSSPQDVGMMRAISTIAGKTYAVGMRRQVYLREGRDRWIDIGRTARPAPGDSVVTSFEAIHGYGDREIYAVGRDGEIWRYDGSAWRSLPSPTNMILTGVLCAPDGYVYIIGRAGTFIRGRDDSWDMIEHGVTEQDFWGLSWFSDRLFVSSSYQVFQFVNGGLSVVDFGEDTPRSCFHLHSAPDVMWSAGAKDLFEFDGVTWTRID